MLYPDVLPLVSMVDTFYDEAKLGQTKSNRKRLRLFYVTFLA